MADESGEYVTRTLDKYVGYGRFQVIYVSFLCFTYGIVGAQTYVLMFASGQSLATWHQACPPTESAADAAAKSSQALAAATAAAMCKGPPLHEDMNCSVPLDRWAADEDSGFVSSFKLVCQRAEVVPALGSIYFLGYAVGVLICGAISDRCGRRSAYQVAYSLILLGGFMAPGALGVRMLMFARFLIGAGVAGVGLVSFVWAGELLDSESRAVMSWLPNVTFSFGEAILSPIAFYITNWRHLLLVAQLVCVAPVLFTRLLPESPQWLASTGRVGEAHKVLSRMALANGRDAPPAPPSFAVDGAKLDEEDEREERVNVCLQLCDRRLLTRFVVMCFSWFSVSFAFYGLSLFSPNLPFDIYSANALSAVVPIPFYLAAPVLIELPWLGRRGTISASYLFGGCFLIFSLFVKSKIWSMVVFYMANGILSLAFAVLYVWAAELFPTDIRSQAMSFQSVFARAGAMLSPFVVSLGSKNLALGLLAFAVPSLISGVLDLGLPETLGQKLPSTLADISRGKDRAWSEDDDDSDSESESNE